VVVEGVGGVLLPGGITPSSSAPIVIGKPLRHGIGIFPVNARQRCAPDIPPPGIIAKLDPVEGGDAVHDIGLAVDDGALEKTVGQKVPDPEVRIRGCPDRFQAVILEGRESRGGG
jgi:hypothetical protein